jgi:branched-chain amino acid transport system permease protein
MDVALFITQLLNGLQLGVMLFLMSAGLTLILGVMNFANLAHGSFYMLGAYLAAEVQRQTGSFLLAALAGVIGTLIIGMVVDLIAVRKLHERDHFDQVLGTFALTLFFNELVRVIWGSSALNVAVPQGLEQTVMLLPGIPYPSYRLLILLVGVLVAIGLYVVIVRTRSGMIVRASASNRVMTAAMGVNVKLLSTFVFGVGAALAGLAGVMAAPILSVESGMGDPILILTLVVIVIGGIGSVRGAILASLIVGVLDTIGRVYLPILLGQVLSPLQASTLGPALSSMLIYLLMAAILAVRPQGLLPARTG